MEFSILDAAAAADACLVSCAGVDCICVAMVASRMSVGSNSATSSTIVSEAAATGILPALAVRMTGGVDAGV